MSDVYFSSVSLLAHLNGADGATTFTDDSPRPKALAAIGGAAISTAQSKFGGSSLWLSTDGLDLVTVQNTADFNLGTGDFTIEAWVQPTTADAVCVFGMVNSSLVPTALTFSVAAGTAFESNYSSNVHNLAGLLANTWYHVAVCRTAGITQVFTGGVAGPTLSIPASIVPTGVYIGAIDSMGSRSHPGYINEVRVTQGVARYSGTFTPSSVAFSQAVANTASASLALPCLAVSSSGGSSTASLALPGLTVIAQAHDSGGEHALNATLPSLSISARAGTNSSIILPKFTGHAAGTVANLVSAGINLPSPTTAASVTVSAMGNAALNLPSMSGESYAGTLCSITIGRLITQATGTTGSIDGAQITLPLFQVVAITTAQNHGSAAVILPSISMSTGAATAITLPGFTLTAIGSATITAAYEAYAVNLKHTPRPGIEPIDEMTHYTNFPFTHVVRFKNSYYGANSTGLYLLEGTTDDTLPITWAVKTAMTDFKNPNLKTLASAYFSGRFGPASNITLSAGEKAPVAYSFTTPRGALAQNHRQSFGRGLKARYYALAASGTGTCEIDAVELDVHNLTRRI